MSRAQRERSHHVGHARVHIHPVRLQPRRPERFGRRRSVPIFERVDLADQSLVRPRDVLRPNAARPGAIFVVDQHYDAARPLCWLSLSKGVRARSRDNRAP